VTYETLGDFFFFLAYLALEEAVMYISIYGELSGSRHC
jgi:hypothetical protein